MSKRELSHGSSYYSHSNYNYGYKKNYYDYDPWARTKKYCKYYPSKCYNYCDWYPSYCDGFCENLPEFCTPEDIRNWYYLQNAMEESDVFSMNGPNWADQVDDICKVVNSSTCTSLKSTIDSGKA